MVKKVFSEKKLDNNNYKVVNTFKGFYWKVKNVDIIFEIEYNKYSK